ncbi:MAG TPA: UDP-N-acetylmuramoyl-tripeptide--D-alanyl-D-alanine ligase, partial [Bacteroidetes bacterium]|nr:UDP-N-acetylmuramoyl-tripeptide--D-alanyl-D-alanine ligase [Bacteroidota bacterium]
MKTMGWTISQALEAWDGAVEAVSCDKVLQNEIAAVVIDSRKVVPGAVFCAIRGERFDAHDFIEEVFKAGALACI